MSNTTIELVTFKLKDSASDDQLLATTEGINAFLKRQPGFIYRSLSKEENNTWVDIVYWQDMDSAKAASDALMQDPEGLKMVDLCAMDSVVMKHLPVLTEVLADQPESTPA